jgi:hypothetical protein
MSIAEINQILTNVSPDELRQRIAEIDRERSALVVLLRAATKRQMGRRAPQPAQPEEVCHAN